MIENGNFISSSNSFSGYLIVENGLIAEFGEKLPENTEEFDETVNACGYTVMPSFVDLHSHFRDPGLTYKEDLESGSRAAVKGGYTCVNLMANTKPVCSSMDTVNYVDGRIKEIGLIDAYQTVSITKDFCGKELSHLEDMDKGKVRIISDDGFGIDDDGIMMQALKIAERKGFVISVHEEYSDHSLDSRESENRMTYRDIRLNENAGAKLHIAHVSTKQAMEYIMEAKKRGVKLTCEVTPHHLTLTDEITYSLHPPLRKKEDVVFLLAALKEGYIDVIATDHAPHSFEDKQNGARGISGIEIAFSVCLTHLVKTGIISLIKLSELMSRNPAEILGVKKGDIVKGYDADLVLTDVNSSFTVKAEDFESKGKNTPFDGKQLFGTVEMVIKKGKKVYGRKKW